MIRPVSNITHSMPIDEVRFDAKQATKPSKPELDRDYDHKQGDVIPSQLIYINMINRMEEYAKSTGPTSLSRYNQVGSKLKTISEGIRHVEHQVMDSKKALETLESRTRLVNYVLNGAIALTGAGLVAAGDPWTGGSLLISGVGGGAAALMSGYGFDSTLTTALSITCGLIGLVGGIGSAANQLYNRGPAAFLQTLGQPNSPFLKHLQYATFLTTSAAAITSGYANMERNNQLSNLSNYDAFYTDKSTERYLLEQKLTGAATSTQGTGKKMSDAIRAISRANSRATASLRVITSDFHA